MSSTTIRVIIDSKGTVSGLDTVNKGLRSIQTQAAKTQDIVSKAYKINFNASTFNSVNQSVVKAMSSVTKLNPAFIKLRKDAVDAGGGIEDTFKRVSDSVSTAKNLLVGGILGSAVVRGLGAAVDESVKLQNALIGVDSVAKSFGHNADDVKRAVLDFTKDGLVSATDAALAFKQTLSSGTSLQDAIRLMNSLKDAAAFNRQAHYDLGGAIVATTEGIKNGLSVKADAVGVTKNLSVMEKEYAASIGTTVGKLTDAQKMQARVTGFIREAAFASGDASKLLDTYSGSVAQLGTAYDRALAKIGDFITQSSMVKFTVSGLTALFRGIDESLGDESPEKRIEKIRSQLNGYLKDVSNSPYKARLQEELALLEQQVSKQRSLSDAIAARKQKEIDVKKAEEETAKRAAQAVADHAKALDKLKEKYKYAGLSELEKLTKIRDQDLKIAGRNADLKLLIEKDFSQKVDELNRKNHDKQIQRANELDKIRRKIFDALTDAAQSPFKSVRMPVGLDQSQQDEFTRRKVIGRGVGVLNNVVGGADGAKKLVASIAGAGLDAFMPGLGQAAQPLLEAFTQGPDAVRGMVKEFAKAIPDVVQGFIEASPAFVEELANQLPVIIERLAERTPDIIVALVKGIPKATLALVTAMPKVALKFMGELIKNIPRIVSELARAVYEGVKKVLQKLTGTGSGGVFGGQAGGGGLQGALTTGPTNNGNVNMGLNIITLGGSGAATTAYNKVKKAFGFAHGGEARFATGGAPFQDSINAKVQSGELVIDRSTTRKLKKQLDEGMGGQDIKGELKQIIALLSQPQQVISDVKLNNEAFARVILGLNRTNQRLA